MLMKLWLPLLLLVLDFEASQAIYCYTCTSMEKASCGDDFRIPSNDANSRSSCDGSCVKRRGERVTQSVRRIEIVRSCVVRKSESCYNEEYNNLKMYTCSCNSDFCNVSSKISSSRSFIVFVSASVLAFIHLSVFI
ncbi:hypothetical protein BsWGS_27274 [Bradybaena similaris]